MVVADTSRDGIVQCHNAISGCVTRSDVIVTLFPQNSMDQGNSCTTAWYGDVFLGFLAGSDIVALHNTASSPVFFSCHSIEHDGGKVSNGRGSPVVTGHLGTVLWLS